MRTKSMILGLAYLLMLGSVLSAEKKQINISWQELFPDQIERVYVIMKDGMTFPYTSHYGNKVYMSIGWLKKTLKGYKNKNYNIEDIAVVIHNHRMNKNFGQEDYRQYWMLKNYGFDGQFLMYCHRTKEVYSISLSNQ